MANRTRDAMDARLRIYIAVLRGGAGLINATNLQHFGSQHEHTAPVSQLLVGRAAFHDYVSKLRLPSDFPGIQGVGFTARVPPEQKTDFVAAVRRDDAEFRIWPAQELAAGVDWHSIVYLEPRDKRNEAAIGFNMYSEPTRRNAMQKARDSGDAATSGKVLLKQEITQNKQAGFLIYVPVYRGPKVPANVKARRDQLLGFVYSPFRAGDFFQTLLDVPTQSRLLFRLYDSEALASDNLLYQSATQPSNYTPLYQSIVPISAAGRNWTLIMETRPDFHKDSNTFLVTFIVIAGLSVSAILFGVTWTQAIAHARAEQTAWELGQSEEARQKLLESERHARLEAEAASRTKDEFLAVVSHELRTPLTSILGWASLLQNSGIDADEFRVGLQTIERNSQAQAQLIEDLLDMSRIVSGRLRIETMPLDLTPILDAALNAARPAAQAKDIQLWRNYATNSEQVQGDPHRLQQIVWNLLTNAIKFTPAGGRVELSLRRIENQIEITVTDTGIGMEAKFLPFAFDRFHQADASSTRSHGGLGLGLAIVRHLAEMHGGQVEAQSEGKEKGSTFIVRLPVLSAVTAPAEAPEQEANNAALLAEDKTITARLSGKKILVVEDDPDSRRMIETILQMHDAQVKSVADVPAALQIFPLWEPDILVSDIGLPGEDGYSLLRQLRALPNSQGGAIPAIALTAFARETDRLAAHEAGFQHHLTKPISPIQLAATVALLVED